MNIFTFYDVRMLDLSKYGNLTLKKTFYYFAFDLTNPDFFNCYSHSRSSVSTSIDFAEATLANLVSQIKDIVLYFFKKL